MGRDPWRDWLIDRGARGGLWLLMRLPYRRRVAVAGRLMRGLGALAGFRARAEAQLAYVHPEMPAARRREIGRAVLDNIGRTLVENFSFADRWRMARRWRPEGPGWPTLEACRREGRPVVVVSGHFGNYQAMQVALNARGYRVGGLYRPMNNAAFNRHYVRTFHEAGGPAFPRGRRGLADFVRHLRAGGQTAILIDQYFADGVRLDFLGKPAPTALSAAEMALRYDALLVPIYAERLENGIDFRITVEAPIPPSDAITMTQALNDSLSARVRRRPGQWLWVHRRWKPGRGERFFPPLDAAPDLPPE